MVQAGLVGQFTQSLIEYFQNKEVETASETTMTGGTEDSKPPKRLWR